MNDLSDSDSGSAPISPPKHITKQQQKIDLKQLKEEKAQQLRTSLLNNYISHKNQQSQQSITKTEQANKRIEKLHQTKQQIEQQIKQQQTETKQEKSNTQQSRTPKFRQAQVFH